jgi:hypothetical protein
MTLIRFALPADLATATSDFADTLSALSICDLNQSLSDSLERFADIGRRSRDVHEENAKNDVRTFMSAGSSSPPPLSSCLLTSRKIIQIAHMSVLPLLVADEYIRLIASVRVRFSVSPLSRCLSSSPIFFQSLD